MVIHRHTKLWSWKGKPVTHTSKSDHWHEDCLNTKIWIAAFIEVDSKKKQPLCSNRSTACSRLLNALIQFNHNHGCTLSPTDMFTYRYTNIHSAFMQRESSETGKIVTPHLCGLQSDSKLQCVRCASIFPLLDLSLSFSLTHFSTYSHRVALVTLYCSELRQRENGGREGGREG